MLRTLVFAWLLLTAGTALAQDPQPIRFGVATGFPPFVVTLPTGELGGFDIDVIDALCAELDTPCETVSLAWEGIIPALIEGRIDAIPSLSVNAERRKIVDFTDKYYETSAVFVGPKAVDVEVSPKGLAGKSVGVQIATVAACYLENALAGTIDIRYYDNQENANLDLSLGRIDLGFADALVMIDGFLTRPDGAAFEVKGDPVFDPECMGVIAYGVRKGDDALRARLNRAIAAIRVKGVFQDLSQSYFGFDIYGD